MPQGMKKLNGLRRRKQAERANVSGRSPLGLGLLSGIARWNMQRGSEASGMC